MNNFLLISGVIVIAVGLQLQSLNNRLVKLEAYEEAKECLHLSR